MSKRSAARRSVAMTLEALEVRLCLASSVGWDGPGLGSAALTYHIANAPASLSQAAVDAAIQTALNAWASVAAVTFTPTSQPDLDNSIDITFAPIDGPGGTLAQTYLPDDVNRSTIAGDVQFDSAEDWEVGNAFGSEAFDLVLTAVHELGHALGLEHSRSPDAVMYPSISPNQSFTALAASDRASILALYAPASPGASNVPTTPANPGVVPLLASTIGAFDPGSAIWYLGETNAAGSPVIDTVAYGAPGWTGLTGDWDGNGSDTIGVVDPTGASGLTWFLRNSDSAGPPDVAAFSFGAVGWVPVAGDWDGDGTTTIGAYDPSTGLWYLRNSNTPGPPDVTPFPFGGPGYVPVAGDWDGDGVDTVGAFDSTRGVWYQKEANRRGASYDRIVYGEPGWTPVAGDWDGDGTTSIGIVDPSSNTWYLKNSNAAGTPDYAPFRYGEPGWTPLATDRSRPLVAETLTSGSTDALAVDRVFLDDADPTFDLAQDRRDPEIDPIALALDHIQEAQKRRG